MSFRNEWKLTRRALAQATNVDRSALTRIEIGRAPLKYEAAAKILRYSRMNPRWLALGIEPKMTNVQPPTAEELGISGNSLFSDTFRDRLASIYTPRTGSKQPSSDRGEVPVSDPYYRRIWQKRVEARAKYWLRMIPDKYVDAFGHAVELFGNDFLKKIPAEPWGVVAARYIDMDALDAKFMGEETIGLTDSETSSRVADVKAQLPSLLERLKKATAQKGKKSELAEYLQRVTKENVPLASVSRWLSGEREPGGEVALQMDVWATAQGYPRAK